MKLIEIKNITNNLDSRRVPLNSTQRAEKETNPIYPYIGANNIMAYIDEYIFDEKILCVAEDGGSWGYNETCAKIYNGKVWVNNHAHVLTAKEELSLEYLMYYLNYTDLSLYINGATRGKLTKTSLNSIKVPIPSLEEQKKIAAILDSVDDYRRKTKVIIDKYDQFIQSLFLDMFGDPVTNPKGFENVLFKDVVDFLEGPGVRKWQFRDSGIKLINIRNLVDDKLDLSNTDKHLTESEVKRKYSHFLLEEGDYVMASSGVTWGKIAEVKMKHLPLCLNTSIIKLKPKNESLNRKYLWYFIKSQGFRMQIDRLITGSAQPNFGPSHLKKIGILSPTMNLQNQFAERVEQIEKQKQQAEAALVKAEELFNSLLQKAFKGELTN